ncbi:MAG: hypothetical protein U5J97_11505 [Trueperaceae bacterium]|nr:hypothetical protein [Trueperaceae bacterium]
MAPDDERAAGVPRRGERDGVQEREQESGVLVLAEACERSTRCIPTIRTTAVGMDLGLAAQQHVRQTQPAGPRAADRAWRAHARTDRVGEVQPRPPIASRRSVGSRLARPEPLAVVRIGDQQVDATLLREVTAEPLGDRLDRHRRGVERRSGRHARSVAAAFHGDS